MAAITAGLFAACGAPLESAGSEDRPDIEAGRRLAEESCARCHAIGVDDQSQHPMAPPFRTLSENYPVRALEEALAEGIMVGHPDMPRFRLAPEQINDLLGYIESIQVEPTG